MSIEDDYRRSQEERRELRSKDWMTPRHSSPQRAPSPPQETPEEREQRNQQMRQVLLLACLRKAGGIVNLTKEEFDAAWDETRAYRFMLHPSPDDRVYAIALVYTE